MKTMKNVLIGKFPRVILSARGREYRAGVIAAVREFGQPEKLHGRLRVTMLLNPPDRRARDIDNPIKAVLDALTHAEVWADDSQIKKLEVEMGEIVIGGKATVSVFQIPDESPELFP